LPAGSASASCTGRGAIFYAGIATASRTPARTRAHWTVFCAALTRSGNAWAAIQACSRRSRRSRRACGGGHTNGCAIAPSTPSCALTKPSTFSSNGCGRISTSPNASGPTEKGVSGSDRDQARFARPDRRHRDHRRRRCLNRAVRTRATCSRPLIVLFAERVSQAPGVRIEDCVTWSAINPVTARFFARK
jgi:hypothetical protein